MELSVSECSSASSETERAGVEWAAARPNECTI